MTAAAAAGWTLPSVRTRWPSSRLSPATTPLITGLTPAAPCRWLIKSGSQKFHGGLWEFNRNDAFDAGYYFFKQQDMPTPELRLNIFGGNIGGPVYPHVYNKTHKTFFFVNEEWRKLHPGSQSERYEYDSGRVLPHRRQPFELRPAQRKSADRSGHTGPGKTRALQRGRPGCGTAVSQCWRGVYTIPANLLDPNAVLFMGTGAIPKPNTANGTQYLCLTEAADLRSRGCSSHRPQFQRQVSPDGPLDSRFDGADHFPLHVGATTAMSRPATYSTTRLGERSSSSPSRFLPRS